MTTNITITSRVAAGGKVLTIKDTNIVDREFKLSPLADISAFNGVNSYEFVLDGGNALTVKDMPLPEGYEQSGDDATVTIANIMPAGYPGSIKVSGGDHDAELFGGESVEFDVTDVITISEVIAEPKSTEE